MLFCTRLNNQLGSGEAPKNALIDIMGQTLPLLNGDSENKKREIDDTDIFGVGGA